MVYDIRQLLNKNKNIGITLFSDKVKIIIEEQRR